MNEKLNCLRKDYLKSDGESIKVETISLRSKNIEYVIIDEVLYKNKNYTH